MAPSTRPQSQQGTAAAAATSSTAATTNPAASGQKAKVTKKKKRTAAEFRAGKQADELKRQTKLVNYRGFVNDTMGVEDMEKEKDPEAGRDGVAGVVERALIDCGIQDEGILTYVDDQLKDFLEQTFKKHFDELK